MQRISRAIGGLKISTLVTGGRKTPILFIHGNSAFGDVFVQQMTQLERWGYPSVAPDLPGHGSSDNAKHPARTYSFPGYARALRDLLTALGIFKYHIVGWSLGGHIGIELWHSDPAAASLLITGSPPVFLSAEGARRAFKASSTMDLAGAKELSPDQVLAYGSAM